LLVPPGADDPLDIAAVYSCNSDSNFYCPVDRNDDEVRKNRPEDLGRGDWVRIQIESGWIISIERLPPADVTQILTEIQFAADGRLVRGSSGSGQ
jgi:hypothetical protein